MHEKPQFCIDIHYFYTICIAFNIQIINVISHFFTS